MLLVVDNGSIYTQNLIEFLSTNNTSFIKLKPEEINLSQIKKFDSFILSGRKQNNKNMNAINSKIIQHAVLEKKKLLGICYGAEILALTLGGTIKKSKTPEKGEREVQTSKENPLCSGSLLVFESHNFEISRLGDTLSSIGKSSNCRFEIIQSSNQKIFGTQFHPEMSMDGKKIITKFIEL